MSLETKIGKVRLERPLVLASGILGINCSLLLRVQENGAGAVTTKSIGFTRKEGHDNPTVIPLEHGILNAVGLSCAGYEEIDAELSEMKKKLRIPLIASIYGSTKDEFAKIAECVSKFNPSIIEVNISCPNSDNHGQIFGFEPDIAREVVSAVKDSCGMIPVMPKLTPNTHKIVEVAKACEEAGASAICAINTVGGMAINIEARKPILHFRKGGLSGSAIKPVAVKCVYDIYDEVNIPILGIGGVLNGRDAIELIEAGASAVGIGSAVYYRGIEAFSLINSEIDAWMKANNVSKISELIGAAHG